MKQLYKLAAAFEHFIKNATLREDLAKRILFGLGDYLGVNENLAYFQGEDGSYKRVDLIALRDLIPQARQILIYGLEACIQELKYLDDSENRLYNMNDYKIYKYVIDNYKKGNLENLSEIFKKIIYLFNEIYWGVMYGGKKWGEIADILFKIYLIYNDAIIAKKTGNIENEIEFLSDLLIHINLFEGMVHNSNGILNKIHDLEMNDIINDEIPINAYKAELSLSKLMNAKEFKNPKSTLEAVLPVLRGGKKSKKQGPFREYIDKAEQVSSFDEETENTYHEDEKINKVRKLKESIKDLKLAKYNINLIKSKNINNKSKEIIKWIQLINANTLYVLKTYSFPKHINYLFNNIRETFVQYIQSTFIAGHENNYDDYINQLSEDYILFADKLVLELERIEQEMI